MTLSIGKVAKLFGISTETLRYYEQAGFLSPKKNRENGYREYDFEDLFLLTDLLFYRDIGIPIKDIQSIFGGMEVDEVSDLISEKKQEIHAKIERLTDSLIKLENWEQMHRESIEYLGRFDIRPMPVALRRKTSYDDYAKMLATFRRDARTEQDLAFFLTFSFFCDFSEGEDPELHRYISLDKSVAKNLPFEFVSTGLVEESAPRCLFTVVRYKHDARQMLTPLLEYAREQRLPLTGQIYGRQSIVYYGADPAQEYYRIYALLSAEE